MSVFFFLIIIFFFAIDRSVHRHGAWGVGIIIVLYLWARYKFLKELPPVLMS